MAKQKGNPKIAEYGKNTQFGRGLDAVECGKAGVEKREEKKAEQKTIASALQLILNAKIPDAMAKKMQAQTGISELDYRTALAYSVISTGIKKGDANALKVIADYIGEKPADNLNINADENSKFADILKQLGDGGNV
jgi:hypothetical protein